MRVLFDVNILMGLGWANHLFHPQILQWFQSHPTAEWWTCALTESAFIRLSSNPKAVTLPLAPADARERLRQMLNHPLHRFAEVAPRPWSQYSTRTSNSPPKPSMCLTPISSVSPAITDFVSSPRTHA